MLLKKNYMSYRRAEEMRIIMNDKEDDCANTHAEGSRKKREAMKWC